MSEATPALDALIAMSRRLAEPERDLVILGEGNTSTIEADGRSFWVKASGTELRTADAESFVQLWLEPVCAMAERETIGAEALKETNVGLSFYTLL